jgi:hypothetical protein
MGSSYALVCDEHESHQTLPSNRLSEGLQPQEMRKEQSQNSLAAYQCCENQGIRLRKVSCNNMPFQEEMPSGASCSDEEGSQARRIQQNQESESESENLNEDRTGGRSLALLERDDAEAACLGPRAGQQVRRAC